MRLRIGTMLAGLALLPAGVPVSGCSSPQPSLSCTAIVSSAHPAQYSNEVVTIKSVAGAKVLSVAGFKAGYVSKTVTTSGLGIGRATYNVGPAAIGRPVPVAVVVKQGGRSGACATSFTPVRRSVSTPSGSSISCDSKVFPGIGVYGQEVPQSVTDVRARGTPCGEVNRVLADYTSYGQDGAWSVQPPYHCTGNSPSAPRYGAIACTGPSGSMTFTLADVAVQECGAANSWILDVHAYGPDCGLALAMMQASGYAGGHSASSFTYGDLSCTVVAQGGQFNCLTKDRLKLVSATLS